MARVDDYKALVISHGPVVYYPMQDSQATTTAEEAMGTNMTWDYPAQITKQKSGPRGQGYSAAASTYSGTFDAEVANSTGSGSPLNITSQLSIEYWIKRFQSPQTGFVEFMRKGYQKCYGIRGSNGNSETAVEMLFVGAAGYWRGYVNVPKDDEFHHICSTFDGRYMLTYFDGKLARTDDVGFTTTVVSDTSEPVFFYEFSQDLSDYCHCAIYDKALTHEEVKSHYATLVLTRAYEDHSAPYGDADRIIHGHRAHYGLRLSRTHSSPYAGRIAKGNTAPYSQTVLTSVRAPYESRQGGAVHSVRSPYALLGTDPLTVSVRSPYGLKVISSVRSLWDNKAPLISSLRSTYSGPLQLIASVRSSWDANPVELVSSVRSTWNANGEIFSSLRTKWQSRGPEMIVSVRSTYDNLATDPLALSLRSPYSGLYGTVVRLNDQPQILVGSQAIPIEEGKVWRDETDFLWRCRAILTGIADYSALRRDVQFTFQYYGEEWAMMVDTKQISRDGGAQPTIEITGLSTTAVLTQPRALPINYTLTTKKLASVVVEEVLGVSVDWQMMDWYMDAYSFAIQQGDPLQGVQQIIKAARGVIETMRDGSIVVRKEFPYTIPGYLTATPDITLVDQQHALTITENYPAKELYNKFRITSGSESTADRLVFEADEDDPKAGTVLAFPSPWRTNVEVLTTAEAGVTLTPLGVVLRERTDIVEFTEGSGSTSYPIYDITDVVWESDNLGALNFDKDTSEITTPTTTNWGYGLACITYRSRSIDYWTTTLTLPDNIQYILRDLSTR